MRQVPSRILANLSSGGASLCCFDGGVSFADETRTNKRSISSNNNERRQKLVVVGECTEAGASRLLATHDWIGFEVLLHRILIIKHQFQEFAVVVDCGFSC